MQLAPQAIAISECLTSCCQVDLLILLLKLALPCGCMRSSSKPLTPQCVGYRLAKLPRWRRRAASGGETCYLRLLLCLCTFKLLHARLITALPCPHRRSYMTFQQDIRLHAEQTASDLDLHACPVPCIAVHRTWHAFV